MVARYLSSIIILYNEKTGLPEVFEVTTPKGDRTVTKLTDIKVNPELTPDNFTIKLPSDVQIKNKKNNFDDEDY
jgi:outer membrane lipoprotein-sorting protein